MNRPLATINRPLARMWHRTPVITLAVLAALGLSACSGPSGSGSSSLITGSVFSSAPKAPVNPDNPTTRHTKVAMVSAAAVKCGFYFDPAKLRVTATQAAGGDKAPQEYDASYTRTATAIAGDAEFCNPGRVAIVKSDLNRHIAGDFTTVAHADKGPKQQSAWDWLVDGGQKADAGKTDYNAVFFPSGGSQTTTQR